MSNHKATRMSGVKSSSTNRRSIIRGALGIAAGATLHNAPAQAGAQATPDVPPGLTVGVDYFPSPAPGVPAAFVKLPTPFQSVQGTPGNGGTVRTMHINYGAPLPPKEENSYKQELDKRLGAKMEMDLVPADNYVERYATTIAGGDLPDILWSNSPDFGKLVGQGAFADLTDYVTGDALHEYPNLAALAPQLWENVAVNGRIYSVPRPLEGLFVGGTLVFRQDWVGNVGLTMPSSTDDFTKLMKAFTEQDPDGDSQQNSWGMGSGGSHLNLFFLDMLFRTPNEWHLNDDGTLTSYLETEEHRQAVAYARDLWAAGVYHPDSPAMGIAQAKDDFGAGAFGGFADGIGGMPGPNGMRHRPQLVDPNAEVIGMVPFGHDGGQGVYHTGPGYFGSVAIPADRDEERIRELLRILNYFAAPTGSEERIFLDFGIEGVHHTVQPDGSLKMTDLGKTEIGRNIQYLIRGNEGFYYPETPGDALFMQQLTADLLALGIENPTLGLYSPANAELSPMLNQLVADRQAEVMLGRDSMDSYDQMVSDWRSRGGDQIRMEFEEALKKRS